jgi:molybdopterin-binding protein
MKISARNMLPGTVKNVTPGAVNTEVSIEIAKGIEVVSIITSDSAKRLALAPGKRAYAVIKASDVLIGTE